MDTFAYIGWWCQMKSVSGSEFYDEKLYNATV